MKKVKEINICCAIGQGSSVVEKIEKLGIKILSHKGDDIKIEIPEPLRDEVAALPGIVYISEDIETNWSNNWSN